MIRSSPTEVFAVFCECVTAVTGRAIVDNITFSMVVGAGAFERTGI